MTVTTVRWEQQQSRLQGGGKRQENGKKMRKEKEQEKRLSRPSTTVFSQKGNFEKITGFDWTEQIAQPMHSSLSN